MAVSFLRFSLCRELLWSWCGSIRGGCLYTRELHSGRSGPDRLPLGDVCPSPEFPTPESCKRHGCACETKTETEEFGRGLSLSTALDQQARGASDPLLQKKCLQIPRFLLLLFGIEDLKDVRGAPLGIGPRQSLTRLACSAVLGPDACK